MIEARVEESINISQHGENTSDAAGSCEERGTGIASLPLKIHWRLCHAGKDHNRSRATVEADGVTALPDLDKQLQFARMAESLGMDSVLVDFGHNKPDPIVLSTALGINTSKIKLIIACRAGVMSPTIFVQQLNTLSALIGGRLSLNVVAGHSPEEQRYYGDFLSHDQRYSRSEEYLTICRALWQKNESGDGSGVNFSGNYYRVENASIKTPFVAAAPAGTVTPPLHHPELFIAGSSTPALALVAKVGDTWISVAEPPEEMRQKIQQVRQCGKEAAIRLSIICRPTREKAVAAASRLVAETVREETEDEFVKRSDSVGFRKAYKRAVESDSHWLTECLWNGAVRTHGAPAISLVGSPEEVAGAIMEYKRLGITQMILSGWPQYQEMCFFGKQVMPLIRKAEQRARVVSQNEMQTA